MATASEGVAVKDELRSRFRLTARAASFRHAIRGIIHLVRTEHNAWIHAASTVAVIASGVLLHVSLADWRWLVLSIALVWMAEAFNTAIEGLCDVVSPDHDDRIGRVKDVAAGAVLTCAGAAAVMGVITLLPYLIQDI